MASYIHTCSECGGKGGYMQPDCHGDLSWDICLGCGGNGEEPPELVLAMEQEMKKDEELWRAEESSNQEYIDSILFQSGFLHRQYM